MQFSKYMNWIVVKQTKVDPPESRVINMLGPRWRHSILLLHILGKSSSCPQSNILNKDPLPLWKRLP